jgi:hypothetical protein
MPYNGDTVIVNVGSLVEFLLELGVSLARPRERVSEVQRQSGRGNILDTTRVQRSAIHRCSNHVSE